MNPPSKTPQTPPNPNHNPNNPNPLSPLLIIRRHLIINIPYQTNPHLRRIIPPQHITNKMRLNLHLHHLQRTPQHPAENIRIPQLILRAPVIGQLHEVRQRILVEDEGELLVVRRPVGDGGGYVEEDFETDLLVGVGISKTVYLQAGEELTLAIISAVSLKFAHRFMVFDFAR